MTPVILRTMVDPMAVMVQAVKAGACGTGGWRGWPPPHPADGPGARVYQPGPVYRLAPVPKEYLSIRPVLHRGQRYTQNRKTH